MTFHRLSLVALGLTMASTASAVPMEFTQQGRLWDSAGMPLDSSLSVEFSLHDSAAGTSGELWTETQTVAFDNGYYSADLGKTTAMDTSDFADNDDVWLEIAVDSGTPLPRIKVNSVPFALVADWADTADNVSTTANLNVSSVSVNGASIVNSSGKIDYSVLVNTPASLGSLTCTAGQTAEYTSSGWDCADADGHTHTGVIDVGRLPAHTHDFGDLTGTAPWNDGSTQELAAKDCAELIDRDSSLSDGVYWIDPDGGSRTNAWQATCDMTYRGGGWTLVGVDVRGDTGPGRLTTATKVMGDKVKTCDTVERSWDDSCWHLSRHMLTNNTEVVFKGGLDKAGTGDSAQLAYAMGRFKDIDPRDQWVMLVGNHQWNVFGGEVYSFSAKQWQGAGSTSTNCNHHGKYYADGWIHWNTADTQKCGGSQDVNWTRNDNGGTYVDQTVGDSTNRASNVAGNMVELWIRGL